MAEDTYFFVNKTSKSESLSQSGSEERRSIGAYIQGRKRATAQHRINQKNDGGLMQGSTKVGSREIEEHTPGHENHSAATWQDQKDKRLHICNAVQSVRRFANPAASNCQIEWLWASGAKSPTSPFYKKVVQADPLVHDLLEYFVKTYEPGLRYIETIMKIRDSSDFRAQPSMMCVGDILGNQMEADALVAAMSARIQDIEGIDQGGRDLIYTNRAIQSVSKSLEKPLDHPARMFRTIYFLAVVAWHHQDTLALRSHLNALKEIADSSGGVEKLHQVIRAVLIKFDGTVSAEQFASPEFASELFAPDSADALHFDNALLRTTINPKLGWRFKDGEHIDVCGLVFHRLILELIRCVCIIESQFKLSSPCAQLVGLASYRIDLVRHQLLEFETTNTVQRLLRMSLLIWILVVFTSEGRNRSMKIMIKSFKDCHAEIRRANWQNRAALHAWILSIGVVAAEGDSATEQYLALQMRDALKEAEIDAFRSQESLVSFLESFLYLHQAQSLTLPKMLTCVSKMQETS